MAAQVRHRVFRLARERADVALEVARGITEPFYRAQSLAAVARWIEDRRVEDIAREAIAAAQSCKDDYKRSSVMTWPIAALIQRDRRELALQTLARARHIAANATPNGSRAYALGMLLEAAWPLGGDTRRSLVEEIAAIQRGDGFWRVSTTLIDALAKMPQTDREFAMGIVGQMSDRDARWTRKATAALEGSRTWVPRDFFSG